MLPRILWKAHQAGSEDYRESFVVVGCVFPEAFFPRPLAAWFAWFIRVSIVKDDRMGFRRSGSIVLYALRKCEAARGVEYGDWESCSAFIFQNCRLRYRCSTTWPCWHIRNPRTCRSGRELIPRRGKRGKGLHAGQISKLRIYSKLS
jgi:hypothetical protein